MNLRPQVIRQVRKEYPAGARLACIGGKGLVSTVGSDGWRFKPSPALSGIHLAAVLGLLLALPAPAGKKQFAFEESVIRCTMRTVLFNL